MDPYTILLVPGEARWTSGALHLASAIARSNGGQLILLRMAPAGHPALLGSPEGSRSAEADRRSDLAEWVEIAMSYDVPVRIITCQYASYHHALLNAAEQLGAAALFVEPARGHFSWWNRLQAWWLEARLGRRGCALHTVMPTGGPLEWTPSATQHSTRRPLSSQKS